MTRRKGEQPVKHVHDEWTTERVVTHMIATGTGWLDAWLGQKATPLGRLSKATGISFARLFTIASQGGEVSRAEVEALAAVWSISTTELIASMPASVSMVEQMSA